MKGKASKEVLEELKEAYNCPLFLYPTPDGKHDFVFKAISHQLHARIRKMEADSKEKGMDLPKSEVDSLLFEECVVWPVMTPEEIDGVPVGLMSTIPKVIQEKSGFTEIDIRGNVLGPNISVIPVNSAVSWPDYTPEELKEVKDNTPFMLVRLRMDGLVFLVRPMTRADMMVAQTALDNSLSVAKCVTMWPKEVDWDKIPAGYIDQIGNVALSISGWETPNVEVVEV